jgi:drug/metabolite transporter (DMT)-like permease
MLFTLGFVALWAAVEALAATLPGRYSLYQIVFTRYVVHIALMAAVWGWRAPWSLWQTRRPVFQLSRSLLMLVMPASYATSLKLGLDPRTIAIALCLAPLFILGLGAAFLRERAPLPTWGATLLIVIAALLLVGPVPLPPPALLLLPLAVALSFSAYVVMTRSLRSETTRANLFYTAFGVAASLAPIVPRVWVTPSPRDFLIMTGVGLLGYAGLWSIDRATEAAPVTVVAPFVDFEVPMFAVLQAMAAGHVGRRTLAASALVLVAGLYLWTRARTAADPPALAAAD